MWPFRHTLKDHLHRTKTIKVEGVSFQIKKLSPLEYLEGTKVMLELFSIYRKGQTAIVDENSLKNLEKTKSFLIDIILGGVVSPKLSRKKEECTPDSIWIEELFSDWTFAQKLGQEILSYTYGKKK